MRMEAVLDAQIQVEHAEMRRAEAKRKLEERVKHATPPAEDLAET